VSADSAPRIALCSGGIRTPERLAALQAALRETFDGCRRVLLIGWAQADPAAALQATVERGFAAGLALEGLHEAADPRRAVEEAEGIYVTGGNSFRLLAAVQRRSLLEPIRRRVSAGMPYLGISAGTNLACPTIRTTNDMPIVEPPDGLGALGLIGFQINPHFHAGRVQVEDGSGGWRPHYGETREERLREYLEENPGPVLGLREGGILKVRGNRIKLSFESARLYGVSPSAQEFVAPCDLDILSG
jgi:dipeptidase E